MANFLKIENIQELKTINQLGYVFDWTKQSSSKSMTFANIHNGEFAGLVEFERQPENLLNYMWLIEVADNYKGTTVAGELLAFVGKDSLKQGFEGFVLFESKTALISYYQEKYGAIYIGYHKMHFNTEATLNLIKIYLEQ